MSRSGRSTHEIGRMKAENSAAVKLTFLGTRGEIEARTRAHRRHSALLIEHRESRIMIDCGTDWRGRLSTVSPTAIVLTHAHPDHAAGLIEGAPCPVYATKQTMELLHRYPIHDRRRVPLRRPINIAGVRFIAFAVHHSARAPAVGYRVSADGCCFFYVPDVAKLARVSDALRGIDLYVGDGASIKRSMVRRTSGQLIGHAAIAVQLGWCKMAHVPRAIFTHCGSGIVRGDGRVVNASIRRLGREHGLDVQIARDGDRLTFARSGPDGGMRLKNP